MNSLLLLKSAKDLKDLAPLLGFKPASLSYIIFKIPEQDKYKIFNIPKKMGGVRTIKAPNEKLKLVQSNLSKLLLNCLDEIYDESSLKNNFSHGFSRGKSIITNAVLHKNKKLILNIDLSNFFSSIHFGRVKGFFIKNKYFLLDSEIAGLLANIACDEGVLPQGSPCSPVIANLICQALDYHLIKLAKKANCVYTRYADDITFSTYKNVFPEWLVKKKNGSETDWEVGEYLESIIKNSGFSIAENKVRVQYKSSRQEVTGLVVNKRVNVLRSYRRRVRAMVFNRIKKGEDSYLLCLDQNGEEIPKHISQNRLLGMMSFIDYVDNSRTNFLNDSYKNSKHISDYVLFLIYSKFASSTSPMIIGEGKTDRVYILQALKKFSDEFPALSIISADNKHQPKISFYKYCDLSENEVNSMSKKLQLRGGVGDIKNFLDVYEKACKKFHKSCFKHPIIFLIDNDNGANKIKSYIKEKHHLDKAINGDEPFYYLFYNCYVVFTPIKGENKESKIEDFFDEQTQSIELNGKKPCFKDSYDHSKYFGKKDFAHYVKEHSEEIDFSGFSCLLDRISQVIGHYYRRD